MKKVPELYVGTMNDALFITDVKPRPDNDYINMGLPAPSLCIPVGAGTEEAHHYAERLVAAWNGVEP